MNQERLQQSEQLKKEIIDGFNKIEWQYNKLKMIIEEEVKEQSYARLGGLNSDTELEQLIKTHLETYQANKQIKHMTTGQVKENINIKKEVINLVKNIAKGL